MVYISGSNVLEERSTWRMSLIPDLFWSFLNFVALFFQTMISPGMTKHGNSYSSDYRRPGDGPPRPPSRRVGRIGRGGGPGAAPPPAGGG